MNALLLPGNSSRHGEWIEKLKTALLPYLDDVKTQHYRHWQSGEERADINHEITVAKQQTDGFEPYVVVAKSIGTVIAVKATAEQVLHPEKLILLGIPVNGGAQAELFRQWLRLVNAPVIIIQNTSDPLGSFDQVKTAFEGASDNLSFVELPGDTHDYLDFATIAKLI